MSAVAVPRSSTRAEKVDAFLRRRVLSMIEHEHRALFLVLATFTAIALCQSWVTPLWFDEFFTLFISRLPSAAAIFHAIPADGQPPLQYWLTHFLVVCFGQSELVLRFPELIAYAGSGFLAWRIARTHGNAVQALFAPALVMGGGLCNLAWTARPYELLLFFTAAAFVCWQAACLREQRRLLPLTGLALALAGAILSHHFGILHIGVFLLAGESVRALRRRRFDAPMMAAVAAGSTPLIITLPLAHRSGIVLGDAVRHSTNFWAHASPLDLLTWWNMVTPLLLITALMLALTREPQWGDPSLNQPTPGAPEHEWAAALALSLLLPIQILVAALATGYSQPKYAVSASLGLALLAAWGLPRVRFRRAMLQPAMALAVPGLLIVSVGRLALDQFQHPLWRPQLATAAVSPVLAGAPGNLPIVVASAYDYLPDWWYSSPPLRQRLIYLSDRQYAVRQQDFLPELTLTADRGDAPMPTADYADFIDSHPRFLLLCSGRARLDWTCYRLANSQWKLSLLAQTRGNVLYRVDRAY